VRGKWFEVNDLNHSATDAPRIYWYDRNIISIDITGNIIDWYYRKAYLLVLQESVTAGITEKRINLLDRNAYQLLQLESVSTGITRMRIILYNRKVYQLA
jgi:hypothetical protein